MKFIFGNWKMNMDYSNTVNFINNFWQLKPHFEHLIYGIAPSSININVFNQVNLPGFHLLGQDVSMYEKGAYTNQISAKMLASYNVDYCLIGHSETREWTNDEEISIKLKNCLQNQISPIICIGETKMIYEQNETIKYIKEQLNTILLDINPSAKKIIIAYEPRWAIGTNTIPTNEQIESVIKTIKEFNSDLIVIYGGSVNLDNLDSLMKISLLDGFLIGNASLNAQTFYSILDKCNQWGD